MSDNFFGADTGAAQSLVEDAKQDINLSIQGRLLVVQAATTGSITLSGAQVIDGYTPVNGDLILVKDQPDAKQNGVYVYSSTGSWNRFTLDASKMPIGAGISVQSGTSYASSLWVSSTAVPSTFVWGNAAVNFYPYSSANDIVEIYTATVGQTIFHTSHAYVTGANALTVSVNGVEQFIGDSYTEIDSNTVSFNTSFDGGERVRFKIRKSVMVTTVNTKLTNVTSIANLRLLTAPSSGQYTVLVEGYYTSGDGGGGSFIWSPTATNADDGGTVINPTGNSGAGRWLRLFSGPVNLLWFGAKTDGSDCTQAMQTAIAASFDIYVPAGVYQFASTLNIKRPVNITGESGMATAAGLGQQTRLNFARGCSGIIFHRADTTADATGVCSKVTATTGADGSILRNITISSGNYSATTGNNGNHGVWLKCRARLENVQVYSFEGDGVHIFASTGASDPNQYGNANNWRLDNVLSYYNAGTGVFVYGTDVNAGQANTVDSSSNKGWGFYDSSFLGNTYVGCHTASNTLGGYKTDNNNARNVFIGCYSEGGQAANSMVWPTLILGGMLDNTGFDANSTAVDVTGGSSGLGSNKPVVSSAVVNSIQTTTGISSGAGAGLQNGTALYFQRTGVAYQFYWSWDTRYNSTGDLRFSYGPNISYIQILGPGNTGFKCGKSVAQLYLPIYRYFWLGGTQDSQDDARQITMGTAAPTTGEWALGDMVINRAPVAGGVPGWRCVTAGTPGVWKAMANLSA